MSLDVWLRVKRVRKFLLELADTEALAALDTEEE
jgi:hypothetical protein